jgi:hypothetical protein
MLPVEKTGDKVITRTLPAASAAMGEDHQAGGLVGDMDICLDGQVGYADINFFRFHRYRFSDTRTKRRARKP